MPFGRLVKVHIYGIGKMNKTIPLLFKTSLIGLSVSLLLGCGPKTSEEYLSEAQKFVNQDNRSAAIVALKNAVQAEPKSAEARYQLAQVYLSSKQFESAEKEFNRALEYGYEPAKVMPFLAKAYQRTGAHAAMNKIDINQAGLSPAERVEIGYLKVLSLVRLEQIDQAKALIASLAAIETNSIYKGLAEAYALVIDKEYSAALDAVNNLKQAAPENPEVLKLLGQLQLALEKPQEAAGVFTDYVKLYPDDVQLKFVLAKLLVDIGKTEEAEPYIDELLKINQINPLLNQLKAAARVAQKDFPEALKFSEAAILNGSTDPNARLVAGYSAYEMADYASANRHFSYIASALPNSHPALRLLAASQLQLGLTNEAGDVLERIDQLNPADAPLFSKASYELLREGNEKDARLLMDKSSSISSTAEDLTRLGLLQLSLNNLDGIVNLEEAVEKSPELESAQTTLATAYIATGQLDKANELAKQWKVANPKDIKGYLLAGQIHVKRDEFAEAEQEYKNAIGIDGKAPEPKMALVTLYTLQKNFSSANKRVDELLIDYPNYMPALAANYLLKKQDGDLAKGIDKVSNALNNNPQDPNLRLLLARIYLAEQRYPESLKVLEEFEKANNFPRGYWKIKGQVLIASNLREAAEKHFDAWLQVIPNDKEAVLGRLLLHDSANEFAQGSRLVRSYLDKRDDAQMRLLFIHFLQMNGELAEAKQAYDKLPPEFLKLPVVSGFLARFQLADKHPEEALENAKLAYQAAPNYRNVMLLIAIYGQLEQSDEGLAFLQQHIAKFPEDMASRMLLAERQIGSDTQGALKSYELAIQENPKNYIAFNNLAYLNLQIGQLQKAKEYGQKAVELMPEDPASVDTLAQVLVAEKAYDKAIKLYDRVINDKMQIEEVYLNYVETLFLAKQNELAKRKITQRTFNDPLSSKRIETLKAKYQF